MEANHIIRRREGSTRYTLGDAVGSEGRAVLRAAHRIATRDSKRENGRKYTPGGTKKKHRR